MDSILNHMQTVHLSNHRFDVSAPWVRRICIFLITLTLIAAMFFAQTIYQAIAIITLALCLALVTRWILRISQVDYTLTASHFQQHFAKGGWVVKWTNISRIGICDYQRADGWNQPLPWIGIRLKSYAPYLDSICPRLASDILMNQRALLYLGAQQHRKPLAFEDIILDSEPFVDDTGTVYKGLLAMLANRMRYQREFFGYDVFISAADLDRSEEEFVGLTRRYLAAAEPDQ